ncbi:MAG TPA: thioredoxin [Candidatus Nanoarchaeia archaeon]|nr:thioredoxin [Candidatus Nanoarchaeia archaeon]
MTNNDKIPELSKTEFDNYTKSGLVLIDFYADWCMPCVMMAPILDELSEKFRGKIKFGKINVEDNHEISRKYSIVSIPNFILFKEGKQAEQFIGSMPAEDFAEKLEKFI